MAEYSKQSVFQPFIPQRLLTPEDRCVIKAFGITITVSPTDMDNVYLFSDTWSVDGVLESTDGKKESLQLNEGDLFACLQAIIRRSKGELTWISQECAYTCSQHSPDGFGGSAVFITAHDVQYTSTSHWLEQRIGEAEGGDTGPYTDDPEASAPQDDNLLLCVVLEGGVVKDVVSDKPEAFSGCECMVIDYDTGDYDPEDVFIVPQGGGKVSTAVGRIEPIALSGIELQPVWAQLKDR